MTKRIELEQFGSSQPEDIRASGDTGGSPDDTAEGDDFNDLSETEFDPIADEITCLERISSTLVIIASEQAGLRARCIGDTIAALGAAAETLLPRLARAGFMELVAEAAQTIARRGQWPELVLSVAPINVEKITGALSECKPGTEVKITADSALGPGEVQLSWSHGGAEIEIEAITLAALDCFRLQLDSHARQGAS